MALVSVYRFTWWDQTNGENVLTPRFATLEAIRRAQGSPLDKTVRVVDTADLDGNGHYPKADVWLVEIFDVVSRQDGNRRVSVPYGEYIMRKSSIESYWLSSDLLPAPFELTLTEVANYLQGKMKIVAGDW